MREVLALVGVASCQKAPWRTLRSTRDAIHQGTTAATLHFGYFSTELDHLRMARRTCTFWLLLEKMFKTKEKKYVYFQKQTECFLLFPAVADSHL